MARKSSKWIPYVVGLVVLVGILYFVVPGGMAVPVCPGSQIYCPGVGCLSGQDKCFPGAKGGPSRTFAHETFKQWPGAGYKATPPEYKEHFVDKKCPDGTRSDGPCLMEFPGI